jgi:hypothetical protein
MSGKYKYKYSLVASFPWAALENSGGRGANEIIGMDPWQPSLEISPKTGLIQEHFA